MKYLSYALDSGTVSLRDAPVPTPSARQVIVRLTHSVVSRGTEKMLLTFGRAGWLERARQHPERVQQVLDKVWTDGPMVARDALQDRLNRPMQLGYASAGVVHAVGVDVRNFEPGMRVACNGPHAEFVRVPQTFCARIPDGVSSEHAALTPIASVGLRALQLAQLDLGSHVAVIGLGMIGSLTAALASAQGARVLGVDPDAGARDRAASMGVFTTVPPEGAARVASARTARHGCDVVFVCTSGRDPAPLRSAVSLCRLGGRVVLVGASDVALDRDAMYAREISLMVSRSYGPGRQEEPYERGVDYPYAHVRWTAQRNFEAILELMARGRLDPAPLIARQAALEDAADVYATLGPGASVFVYPEAEELPEAPTILRRDSRPPASMELGVIGAGNYARRVFLPALRDAGARAHAICAPDGVRAAQLAEAFDVPVITSDPDDVFADPSIGVVALLTRHDAHARLAVAAMRAGKDVYVEKPLALTLEELQEVERVHAATGRRLMVGFNRRFAPTTSALRERLARHDAPAVMTMTVNAGALEPTHWTRQPDQGGRIVGEAVHMVDLMRHLAMSPIVSLDITEMLEPYEDNAVLTMRFASGALASIQYTSMGHTGVPKERLEVFVEGCVYQLDNFRTLRAHDDQPASVLPDWLWRSTTTQDKGHAAMVAQWWSAMRGGDPAPIAAAELFEVAGALLSARGVGV